MSRLFFLVILLLPVRGEAQVINLSPKDGLLFADGFIKANYSYSSDELPKIVVEDRYKRLDGVKTYAEYTDNVNTIYIYKDALMADIGTLENVIVHEMLHFEVDRNRSVDFEEYFKNKINEILSSFDIDECIKVHDINKEDLEIIILSLVRDKVEENYVSETALEFDNYQDLNNAMRKGRESLEFNQAKYKKFLSIPITTSLSGEDIVIPVKSSKISIYGDYICIETTNSSGCPIVGKVTKNMEGRRYTETNSPLSVTLKEDILFISGRSVINYLDFAEEKGSLTI